MFFDGVAYLPQMEGSRDTCILQAGVKMKGIYVAALDLDQLRTYRGQDRSMGMPTGIRKNTAF